MSYATSTTTTTASTRARSGSISTKYPAPLTLSKVTSNPIPHPVQISIQLPTPTTTATESDAGSASPSKLTRNAWYESPSSYQSSSWFLKGSGHGHHTNKKSVLDNLALPSIASSKSIHFSLYKIRKKYPLQLCILLIFLILVSSTFLPVPSIFHFSDEDWIDPDLERYLDFDTLGLSVPIPTTRFNWEDILKSDLNVLKYDTTDWDAILEDERMWQVENTNRENEVLWDGENEAVEGTREVKDIDDGELQKLIEDGDEVEVIEVEEEKHGLYFWGNSDLVGSSPWDFTPPPLEQRPLEGRGEEGKLRVLFLIDYQDYLHRMNTHTTELIHAALRHPSANVDVWGPGWMNWDRSLRLSENLANWRGWGGWNLLKTQEFIKGGVGQGYWDLVWTISDIFKKEDERMDHPGGETIFLQQVGDCHSDDCIHKWYPYVSNITVVKYPHELMDMFSYERIMRMYPGMSMQLFSHSADSANPWDFYPLPWNEKTVDARGFGFDGSFYPIRTTVTDSINRALRGEGGEVANVDWFRHPGYEISGEDAEPPLWYDVESPLQQNHKKTREAFAQGMREAKICIFDSSLERKMIRKFAQAMLSGCVIASDLPTDRTTALGDFMIQLKPHYDIHKINAVLQEALADPEELQKKALKAFAYARQYLTNTKKVDDVFELWKGYKDGWRGYHWRTEFDLRCRQYWAGEDQYRPKWCQPNLDLEGKYNREHDN